MESKLQQAGLDISRVPVFLVLGQPKGSTNAFFEAGKQKRTIPVFSDEADSPFSVHASDDAVYHLLRTKFVDRQAIGIAPSS